MKLGVLGGSGLYDIEGIESVRQERVKTPFGDPSDAYTCGKMAGHELCFLPRHAHGHKILPSEINHRANICGFKMLGVERVISISAVGSLREELRPGDLVLPDQYFDRTKSSAGHTFFGGGVVAHVSFGDPACADLRHFLYDVANKFVAETKKTIKVVNGGTYVQMEGPAFSTRAESETYRRHGFDIIGMTSMAEAKLCREAELCYQAMSLVTDYDCWRKAEESVTIDIILATLSANSQLAKELIRRIAAALPEKRACGCGHALKHAIVTSPDVIPAETKKKLKVIIGKYVS